MQTKPWMPSSSVKASYVRQARAIAEDRALTNVGKRAAYRDFRKRRQAAFDKLRQQAQKPSPPKDERSFVPELAGLRAVAGSAWRCRRIGASPALAHAQKRREPLGESFRGSRAYRHEDIMGTPAAPRTHASSPAARVMAALPASKVQRRSQSSRVSNDDARRDDVSPPQLAGSARHGLAYAASRECGLDPVRRPSPSLSSGSGPSDGGSHLPSLELDQLEITVYGKRSKRVRQLHAAQSAGVALGLLVLLGASSYGVRRAKRHEGVHGTADWATKDEIASTGLLSPWERGQGVYVGAWRDSAGECLHYLRHDSPEHVLAIAPTRSGKGVGLVVPTLFVLAPQRRRQRSEGRALEPDGGMARRLREERGASLRSRFERREEPASILSKKSGSGPCMRWGTCKTS